MMKPWIFVLLATLMITACQAPVNPAEPLQAETSTGCQSVDAARTVFETIMAQYKSCT